MMHKFKPKELIDFEISLGFQPSFYVIFSTFVASNVLRLIPVTRDRGLRIYSTVLCDVNNRIFLILDIKY